MSSAPRSLRVLLARAARAVLGSVPGRCRVPAVNRLLNLAARVVWELALRHGVVDAPTLVVLRSGARLEVDPADRLQGTTWLTRAYDTAIATRLAAGIPEHRGVMFDVGANAGLVALEVLGRRPLASYFCFEPFPSNASVIRRQVALNKGCSVTVVEAAVGASEGTARLGVSDRSGESGHHSVVLDGPGMIDETIEVAAITLDDFAAEHGIERVHALKIDVEGAEPDVLEGARRLLSSGCIDLVILEINDAALVSHGRTAGGIVETMASFGFRAEALPSEYASELFPRRFRSTVRDVAFVRGPTPPG